MSARVFSRVSAFFSQRGGAELGKAFNSSATSWAGKLESQMLSIAAKHCILQGSSRSSPNCIVRSYHGGPYFPDSSLLQKIREKVICFLRSRSFNSRMIRRFKIGHSNTNSIFNVISKVANKFLPGQWSRRILGALSSLQGVSTQNRSFLTQNLRFNFYHSYFLHNYGFIPKSKLNRSLLFSRLLHGKSFHQKKFNMFNSHCSKVYKYKSNFRAFKSFKRWTSFYFKRNAQMFFRGFNSNQIPNTFQRAYGTATARAQQSLFTALSLESLKDMKELRACEPGHHPSSTTAILEPKSVKRFKKTKTASQPRKSPLIKPVTKPRLQIDTSAHTQKLDKPSPRKSQIWSNDKHIPGNRTVLTINFNTNYGAIGISTPAVNKQLNSHDFATFMEQIQSAQKKKDLYLNRLFEHLSASPLNLIYVNLIAENNCIAVIFDSLSEAPDATTVTDLVLGWGIELDVISATVHGPIQADTATRNDGIVPYQNIVSGNPLLNQSVSSLDDLAMSPFNLDGSLDSSMYSLVVEEVVEPEALYNYEVNNFLNTLESTPRPRFTPYVPSSNLLFS